MLVYWVAGVDFVRVLIGIGDLFATLVMGEGLGSDCFVSSCNQ